MKNVCDHLGNPILVGSPVISGNGRGSFSGTVQAITGKRIRIRADGCRDRSYLPPTWFFSRPACGWVLAPESRVKREDAITFDVIKRGEIVDRVKAASNAAAIEAAVSNGISGVFRVTPSTVDQQSAEGDAT